MIRGIMTVREYLEKVEAIRKIEFLSSKVLAEELNISWNTLTRIKSNPESAQLSTMKKIKKFVDAWEAKNPGKSV